MFLFVHECKSQEYEIVHVLRQHRKVFLLTVLFPRLWN